MPDVQNKTRIIPRPVQNALAALAQLRAEDAAAAKDVEKLLPGYALQLQKDGKRFSTKQLLKAARGGAAFLKESRTKKEFIYTYPKVTRQPDVVQLHTPHYDGKTPEEQLSIAVAFGDLPRVKALIAEGVACNIDTLAGAARNGHLEVIKFLHQQLTSISDDELNLLLYYAAQINRLDIVKYLYPPGTVLKEDILHARTIRALADGKLDIAEYLIENNGGLVLKSAGLDIRLHRLIDGDLDIIRFLHRHEPAICAQIYNNEDEISGMIELGHMNIIHYLLQNGMKTESLPGKIRRNLQKLQAGLDAWKEIAKTAPPSGLHKTDPRLFKKEEFEFLSDILKKEGYGREDANKMAYNASVLFATKENIMRYLKRWTKEGSHQPLHDLIYMIELPKTGDINLNDWRDAVIKCGPSMAKLVKFGDKLPSPLRGKSNKSWSAHKTQAEVAKFAFKRAAEHPRLAALCFSASGDETAFEKALALVEKGAPAVKNIPDITIDGKDFDMDGAKFYRLAADDIRGLFLGEFTGCCQLIGNAGASCAEHGYASEDGGFYVIEKRGKIVGQTWAWRGENDEMCFDSLETLGSGDAAEVTDTQWEKILHLLAKELAQRDNHTVAQLNIGIGGKTPQSLQSAFENAASLAMPKNYTGYQDSKKQQAVVWKRKGATL